MTVQPLTQNEQDQISMYMGYMNNDWRIEYAAQILTDFAVTTIRNSLANVASLDTQINQANTWGKATEVDDIKINLNYRDDLKARAAAEVSKIARAIKLPVIANFYITGDSPYDTNGSTAAWGATTVR